jgi:hypothetical protein
LIAAGVCGRFHVSVDLFGAPGVISFAKQKDSIEIRLQRPNRERERRLDTNRNIADHCSHSLGDIDCKSGLVRWYVLRMRRHCSEEVDGGGECNQEPMHSVVVFYFNRKI